MNRGRPYKSLIRDRITVLLDRLGFSYGYEIYKYYKQLFDNTSSRIIYYHLRKGVDKGEFVVVNIKRVPGSFTWGNEVERVYYSLGPYASTRNDLLNNVFNINISKRSINFNWDNIINDLIVSLKQSIKDASHLDKLKILSKCDKLLLWAKNKSSNFDLINKEINAIKLFLK